MYRQFQFKHIRRVRNTFVYRFEASKRSGLHTLFADFRENSENIFFTQKATLEIAVIFIFISFEFFILPSNNSMRTSTFFESMFNFFLFERSHTSFGIVRSFYETIIQNFRQRENQRKKKILISEGGHKRAASSIR